MLAKLKISNLAVIKNIEIEFGEGLNVFTGETGAGKSVMLKAINLIIGARCAKDMIRFGEKSACVEATFKVVWENFSKDLTLNELKINNLGREIKLKRTIFIDGKSTAEINGCSVSVNLLKKIGSKLVYLSEQGSGQNLIVAENCLKIVDDFANINELVLKYRKYFVHLNKIMKRLQQIDLEIKQNNEKLEQLSSFIAEIEQINIKPDEDEQVCEKLKLLKNSEQIFNSLNLVNIKFSGNETNEGTLNELEIIMENLKSISIYGTEFENIFNKFQTLFFEFQEIKFDVEKLQNSFDYNLNDIEFLENRLSELTKIKRKFGPELADVLKNLEKFKKELKTIQSYGNRKEELIKLKNVGLIKFKKILFEISEKRKKAATKISAAVLNELRFLEMKDVEFVVDLKKHKADLNGLEDAQFLISANLGEPLKSIAKVASGGELSRIMLALVSVISNEFKPETLIFDEIDSGVSGIAAEKIGLKLKQLAKNTQIICITHLAQIAAIADENFKIIKKNCDGRVYSSVSHLNCPAKINEIARIIGGSEINDLTLQLATEMVEKNK